MSYTDIHKNKMFSAGFSQQPWKWLETTALCNLLATVNILLVRLHCSFIALLISVDFLSRTNFLCVLVHLLLSLITL